ncbi:MAG: hypothetical protein ACFFCW_18040 [Candidatus Hodarchaeota archaeon]
MGTGLEAKTAKKPVDKKAKPPVTKKVHNERCPKCKDTIRRLLEKIYGRVYTNHRLTIGTQPEDFKKTGYYNELKDIFETLQKHRGFKEFVKAKILPHCDYFVPNPGLVPDIDESQHFILPRKIVLERYPESLKLGFDRKDGWICARKSTPRITTLRIETSNGHGMTPLRDSSTRLKDYKLLSRYTPKTSRGVAWTLATQETSRDSRAC